LEQEIVDLYQQVLGIGPVGVKDNFFELGGNSLKAAMLTNKLQDRLGQMIYAVALFDAPTPLELSQYLQQRHLEKVGGNGGIELEIERIEKPALGQEQIDRIREIIRGGSARGRRRLAAARERCKRAIFILSAPRSGSTLLRVMLGGHSRIF